MVKIQYIRFGLYKNGNTNVGITNIGVTTNGNTNIDITNIGFYEQ